VLKKKIIITGGNGLLGNHFYKKYKNVYKIIKYPYRIENFKKFDKWLVNKKFNYFIHFAAITKNESKDKRKLTHINVTSTIKMINSLNKKENINFQYFLFISSSHVYGFSNKKIKETKERTPKNLYGKSKKRVEDYLIKNRNKLYFKAGIARIFNVTGIKQRKGNFVPDMVEKMKKVNRIHFVNQFRDFIHIDDVSKSIRLLIEKTFEKPINISSGQKINLINACKILNNKFSKKKISYDNKRGKDIFGDNTLLRNIGIKKFKSIKKALLVYRK
tara:strand:+ start:22 stop:843 length:822 start_codon:yes stop_codon:yes gene_type:complete